MAITDLSINRPPAPEHTGEILPGLPLDGADPFSTGFSEIVAVEPAATTQAELDVRFDPDRIADLTSRFLEEGIGFNLNEKLGDRKYVVAYIDAMSEYSDIARVVETKVFDEWFKLGEPKIVDNYGGVYDEVSTFVCVIDASLDKPKPVGALRIVEHSEEGWFKDVRDFVKDDPANPWLEEIKQGYFNTEEPYDAVEAWNRMLAQNGDEPLDPAKTLDITSHAAIKEYRNKNGSLDGVSMLFFHACLRWALVNDKENLVAIFDLKPLENMQQFGQPFDIYEGITPQQYEDDPNDKKQLTLPAYCVLERGMQRMKDKNPLEHGVFIGGVGLAQQALLPNEYLDKYSNESIGLPSVEAMQREIDELFEALK